MSRRLGLLSVVLVVALVIGGYLSLQFGAKSGFLEPVAGGLGREEAPTAPPQ